MEEKQIAPTPEIFSGLIKGCIRNSDAARAFQTFDHMRVRIFDPFRVLNGISGLALRSRFRYFFSNDVRMQDGKLFIVVCFSPLLDW